MDDFYERMAEILEVDTVGPNDQISSFDSWDSLGVLSILALADSRYGVTITGEEIARLSQVGELQKLIETKMSGK